MNPEIKTVVAQARDAMRRNMFDEAEGLWRVALKTAPEEPVCRGGLADALASLGRPQEALWEIDAALASTGETPRARAARFGQKARILAKFGNTAAALEAWNSAIALEEGNASLHLGRSKALAELDQRAAAAEAAGTARRLAPEVANIIYFHGRMLLQAGDSAAAADAYADAIKANPELAAAQFAFSRLQPDTDAGRARALTAVRHAVRLSPANSAWRYALGLALDRSGDSASALVEIKRATAGGPPNHGWLYNLARLHEREGAFDAAYEAYERSIAAGRDDASVYAGRARAALALGDIHMALESYCRACKTQPENPLWHAEVAYLEAAITGDEPISVERPASWYDDIYARSAKYQSDPHDSVYIPVWCRIAVILRQRNTRKMLDIGCGTGQFAGIVRGEIPELDYIGFDFSERAIELAVARGLSGCRFFVGNALDLANYSEPDVDVYLCTEVLEHIQDDLGILARVPAGRLLVFSVPNFDSTSHVRHFKDKEEVRARYASRFENLQIEVAPFPNSKNKLFLSFGRVRA
jgi:tetratricopeptide (TPR) repeat protein